MTTVSTVQVHADEARVRAARRRIWRFAAASGALAIALIGLMTWQRDSLRIQRARSNALEFAHDLEASTTPGGPWPTSFPILGVTSSHASNAAMTYVGPKSTLCTAAGKPVLAFSDPVVSFMLPAGRALIVDDDHKLHIEWISESSFQQMGGTPRG